MTMKVCKFVVGPGTQFPTFEKADNTVTDDVVQLGQDGSTYFFSYDDANVTITAQAENELKVYNFDSSDDLTDIKNNVVSLTYVTQQTTALEDNFMRNRNVYSVVKAMLNNDATFAADLAACEDEKDAFLQGLGLPGTSILS